MLTLTRTHASTARFTRALILTHNHPHLVSLSRPYSTDPHPPAQASLTRSPTLEGLSFIQLDRPKAKNALSVQLIRELRELFEEVRFDGWTRAVILRSAVPGSFCAGADLKERATMSQLDVARFLYNLRRLLGEIEDLPVPTIAAVDGPALGGGLELALACDLRVAGSTVTKIGLPETRLAIIPGAGGTQRLSRLIGSSRAKDLIFASKILNAGEAERAGVVNYVSAEGQSASEKAEEVVGEMLQAGPLALRAAKTAIDTGSQLDLESGLDVERLSYQTILQTEDRLEGLKAFAEKRKPVYKGR
ncbi:methylglutaconyl-CoA hydratase [Rhodotorula toruloides]|uniref:BY PROTMAP: gi/472584382/gb/EMS21976.1/ methylglutaconyl-CoA hydratase [Rhodosporidium toruloides NP11] gi/647395281/emb/CDR36577.1/ RHTO0S02e04016g1_1 [Rhodosporidium toruloides] n=1 Tax=Rhodotorula toruloides TaxID=5286 RepID=A0A0K3CJG2_RHOTO|nr:methylglutaconyl-CoA hydratase [Rhodotorula toruloides]PRQ73375.1 ClpP/crotonase [Rhodotorula toruloides]